MLHGPLASARDAARHAPSPEPRRRPVGPADSPLGAGALAQRAYGNQAVLRTLDGPASGRLPTSAARGNPAARGRCACGGAIGTSGECAACRARRLISTPSAGAELAPAAPPAVAAVLRAPGHPLDPATRRFMETHFNRDFGRVRIHHDDRAAEAAGAVDALAFAIGRDIVFGRDQYRPRQGAGRWLLAHELGHVAQQAEAASGRHPPPYRLAPDGAQEAEADRAADLIGRGHTRPALALAAPAALGLIHRYRRKGAFNFGRVNEPGLEEQVFTDAKMQPWIERITVHFNAKALDQNPDPDLSGDMIAIGTLEAVYHDNAAKLTPIKAPIGGGSVRLGLTDAGKNFTVHRIEGIGYSDVIPADPEPKNRKYSKSLNASMSYAVFFKEKQALHGGALDFGSHACVHVDWNNLHTIRQINYHSVVGRTKVDVTYDAAALTTLCCARGTLRGAKQKGDIPHPCRGQDPKACP